MKPPANAAPTRTSGRSSGEPAQPSSALERPEVLAAIAFGGAFLAARILKRLVD